MDDSGYFEHPVLLWIFLRIVWCFTIPGDGKRPAYLHFHTLEAAFESQSLNPIYKGHGNAAPNAG